MATKSNSFDNFNDYIQEHERLENELWDSIQKGEAAAKEIEQQREGLEQFRQANPKFTIEYDKMRQKWRQLSKEEQLTIIKLVASKLKDSGKNPPEE